MKIKYLMLLVLYSFSSNANAQTDSVSLKQKQFSAGYNILRPVFSANTSTELPVGFIKYRVNDHAFRILMNSGLQNKNYRSDYPGLPTDMFTTDSNTIYTYKYFYHSGGSVSISFEKYQSMKVNNNLEFYVGIGLTGGTSITQEGNNYVTYQKDSTGIFHLNDSISRINFPIGKNNFKSTQLGLMPYGGILFMPDKLFSAEFEVCAPFIYESKIPETSAFAPSSGIYFNMFFSVNLLLNFDLNFKDED